MDNVDYNKLTEDEKKFLLENYKDNTAGELAKSINIVREKANLPLLDFDKVRIYLSNYNKPKNNRKVISEQEVNVKDVQPIKYRGVRGRPPVANITDNKKELFANLLEEGDLSHEFWSDIF